MSTHIPIIADSQLAEALKNVVGSKVKDMGWNADDTLTEYIILMLQSGKLESDLAHELAEDLLDLEAGDSSAVDFSKWLFEQINILNQQINAPPPSAPTGPANQDQDVSMDQDGASAQGSDMGDGSNGQKQIPTGPKAMRGGSGRGASRHLNQINRQMDRNNDPLKRIQGTGAGSGRINSHAGRGGARGNMARQIQRNFEGPKAHGNNQNPMMNTQFMPTMPVGPNQQATFLQMMEEHARMMQMVSQGFMNPSFQGGDGNHNGQSTFASNGRRPNNKFRSRQHKKPSSNEDGDTAMADDASAAGADDKDPSQVMCKFNLYCTKPDCHFAHQSPAAPPGVSVDTTIECTYGAACKNFKCIGRHPSPAKKFEHQAAQECRFGPNCQNPKCQFKHSATKSCRNGGDCTDEGCPFFHSPIECKFTPCTNPNCIYKHKEGQKTKAQHVWKAGGEGEHVSERKFVADGAVEEEERIIPGQVVEMADVATTPVAAT
ncbi:hypothetical protein BT63DRAFT_423193 [Microthyrium microscopicum]|uniref:Nab2-like CCCH zinc finger domain-containing protein n=1 Tax=Microthyrium microscopicum TaxID=703497 RepID=A0A6A6UF64_9PEZI|nr:hypothetical protein BT63DRAFT_423193 [Microthyrium microscopicum]